MTDPRIPDPSYQDQDIRLKPLAISLAVLLGVVALAMLAMLALFRAYDKKLYQARAGAAEAAAVALRPPEPRLQVREPIDFAAFRTWEKDLVEGYGWTVHTNGETAVRIPVEIAKQHVLEQGLPVRAPEGAAP